MSFNEIKAISPDIKNLASLQILNLSSNKLNQDAVSQVEWKEMKSLQVLSLVQNLITEFPTSLLSSLYVLTNLE